MYGYKKKEKRKEMIFLQIFFAANYLEVEVCNPITHTDPRGKRYTDYEVRMRTNLPVFK